MKKTWTSLLIAELLVVGIVPVIFMTIAERRWAGVVAGAVFIALGLYIFGRGLREPLFRRSASFYAGCLHLFVSALPLFISRLMSFSTGFEDVKVLGLPGPVFHRLSTGIFFVLLAATSFDLLRSIRPEDRGS